MEDKPFFSLTGTPEVAEPTESNSTTSNPSASTSPTLERKSSISSIPSAKKVYNSQTTSATSSPRPSRESSPVRPSVKPVTSTRPGPGRSRKNSNHEVSPSRTPSALNNPSSAAIQRALSSSNTPQLTPVIPDSIKQPVPQKAAVITEQKEAPRWPISPRLRSPPPVSKILTGPRKPESDTPIINVQRSTPITETIQAGMKSDGDDSLTVTGMRTPARGVSGTSSTLETVEEISQPSTPALGHDGSTEKFDEGIRQLTEQDNVIDNAFNKSLKTKSSAAAGESGSESGEKKGEIKMRSTSVAPNPSVRTNNGPTPKPYVVSGAAARGKPSGEGSTKNMTVETETVSSIPQVAVGGGTGGAGNNGSLRAKPSSETIRPKKKKEKTARKTPSVTSGIASSKADIFEAKIASAVDEANSSDSEETFVYESNPPEQNDRPRRFHSRTPSATSMVSQMDQRGNNRTLHGGTDNGHTVAMKKSMKFANSYSSNGPEATAGEDDGNGSTRGNGTGRGTTRHHHIGRWGRSVGNGHPSLFDNESPFPNAAKSKLGGNSSRQSSRPTSPKVSNGKVSNGKRGSQISLGYDIDDGAGADDERTPLIPSTIRSTRSGRHRRPASSSMRQLEHQALRQNKSILNRFAGCLVLTIMILLVISGGICFVLATTQPLSEVQITALKKVLASQQELLFNIQVRARNPNVMLITVDGMNLSVYAKSKHASPDDDWWKWGPSKTMRRRGLRGDDLRALDDSPWDPPVDDDPDAEPLLFLGYIYEFDSPLMFDGSPFQHTHTESSGEVRLAKPGNNSTVTDGAERWERVLKYEFDLIVQGTLKYQLPLSQRVHSVNVDGRTTVKPSNSGKEKVDL